MGNTFRPGGLQRQQQEQYQSQQQEGYHRQHQQALSQSVPRPYPTDQISQPMNTTEDEENTTTTLSHETRLKIAELKRLVYRHHIFSNPDIVIKCVTHFAINGDNTLLDEKLEQHRMFDTSHRESLEQKYVRFSGV